MSRYLVTGATGFLGKHLVRALLARGHEVIALSRMGGELPPGAVARRGDVLDEANVRDAAAGCDGAFHCAGMVSRKPEDAEALYRVHVEGTKAALAACEQVGVRRVVVASSSGTIAVSDDPDYVGVETDDTPIGIIARFPYYRAKLFAERAALATNAPGRFEVVCINPSLLLGPGDERGSSTEDLRLLLERRVPAVPPGGASFVDVRDAAEAMVLAMDKGVPGERYLVSSCNITVRELFARIGRIAGVPTPTLTMPRMPSMLRGRFDAAALARTGASLVDRALRTVGASLPVDPVSVEMSHYYWYVDPSRAEHLLGWHARDPNETLADTIRDLRERGVVWPEPPAFSTIDAHGESAGVLSARRPIETNS